MPLPQWRRIAVHYPKHRQATPKDWDRSKAKALSIGRRPVAQYNPRTMPLEVIETVELACLDERHAITDLNDESINVHKFYMDCRVHFGDPHFVAGYCDGEATPYVLVRWDSSGNYHGQPASVAYLRKQGVEL